MVEQRLSPLLLVKGPFQPPGHKRQIAYLPLTIERGDRIVWEPKKGIRFESTTRAWFQGDIILAAAAGSETGMEHMPESTIPIPYHDLAVVRVIVMTALYGLVRSVLENSRDDHAVWIVQS